jgi:hypothetical protein
MRNRLAWISGAAALLCLSCTTASAQWAPRNFERGPVTLVQQYDVKPGQLNAFMQDLATDVRPLLEEAKASGAILSYGVAQPVDPRPGEPNLSLVITFKNLAAYDRPLADMEKSSAAHYGSLAKARDALMKRDSEATFMGALLLRNLEFSK